MSGGKSPCELKVRDMIYLVRTVLLHCLINIWIFIKGRGVMYRGKGEGDYIYEKISDGGRRGEGGEGEGN